MAEHKATTAAWAFLLSEVQQVEGETILIADCADYDAYQALPRVLLWQGNPYSLTGWDSDRCRACYKVTDRVAMVVGGRTPGKWLSDLLPIARELDRLSGSGYCWGCGRERDEDHKADCVLYPSKKMT